ncbi:MAG TPA: DUF1028 domain-containing protein [Ignavibacteriaceae bacterium]
MKRLHLLPVLLLIVFFSRIVTAQDTFSIVAINTVTGQVGSAGASCIAGSIIISDVHPGRGVIHTQSFYIAQNQNYANYLMNQGYSPQQIIDSLIANDAQNNPGIRQYGIVDLIDGGRSAGFTGVNCFDYKGHLLGTTYAIAGNILLGPQVLDSMEIKFLNTTGTLADKLMAALQGAKVIGADTRCTSRGTSSISAFIRVANPLDPVGQLHLNLNVNNTPVGIDPIDSLQVLYNMWVPVELISLSASVNSGKVILRWSTASELNNMGFEIERSTNKNDWRLIGFKEGNGTTTETQSYSFADDLSGTGSPILYYRLKQLDFDGSFEYFPQSGIEVNIDPAAFSLSQNYPNPFNSSSVIKYSIPHLSGVSIKIFSTLGEELVTLVNGVKPAGVYEINWNAGSLPGGVYFYRLQAGSFVQTRKMILLK